MRNLIDDENKFNLIEMILVDVERFPFTKKCFFFRLILIIKFIFIFCFAFNQMHSRFDDSRSRTVKRHSAPINRFCFANRKWLQDINVTIFSTITYFFRFFRYFYLFRSLFVLSFRSVLVERLLKILSFRCKFINQMLIEY